MEWRSKERDINFSLLSVVKISIRLQNCLKFGKKIRKKRLSETIFGCVSFWNICVFSKKKIVEKSKIKFIKGWVS